MDIITQRFIAIGNRLISGLRKISSDILQIQKHIKAIAEQPKTADKENRPPPEVIARLAFPAGIDTEKNASEKRKQRRDRWRLFVEVLTLIAVTAYGLVAYHQWKQMKIAANAAEGAGATAQSTLENSQKAFKLEQRPYVIVKEGSPVFIQFPTATDPTTKADVTFINIGKTPAFFVAASARIFPLAKPKTDAEFTKATDKIMAEVVSNAAKPDTAEEIRARQDVAPQATLFITKQPRTPLSSGDVTQMLGEEKALVYLGLVDYRSVFGEQFRTEFCSYHFGRAEYPWHFCPTHNTIR